MSNKTATTKERLARLEIQMYIVITLVTTQLGIKFVPYLIAALS